jgi:hypothetical protein
MIKAGLFHSDGQPFSAERFKREVQEGVMKAATKQVEHMVADVECPVHRRRATVRRTASGWEIEACCETLKTATLEAVERSPKRR